MLARNLPIFNRRRVLLCLKVIFFLRGKNWDDGYGVVSITDVITTYPTFLYVLMCDI